MEAVTLRPLIAGSKRLKSGAQDPSRRYRCLEKLSDELRQLTLLEDN